MSEMWNDPKIERRIGYLLIANAVLGTVLGLAGLVGLWWAEPRIGAGAAEFAALAHRTVDTTSGLLVSVDEAAATARGSLGTLDSAVSNLAGTLGTTAQLTANVGDIAGGDVLDVITETGTALRSVERSARLVDDTLRVLARLPLVGRDYQPEVPLHAAVGRVADSLAPLPDAIRTVEGDLATTSASLEAMEADVTQLAASLQLVESSLEAVADATADYRAIAAGLEADLARFEAGFPRALRFATVFGSAVMLWLILAQLGLLTQGLERLHPTAPDAAPGGPGPREPK